MRGDLSTRRTGPARLRNMNLNGTEVTDAPGGAAFDVSVPAYDAAMGDPLSTFSGIVL